MSFSKNGPTTPPVNLQEKDGSAVNVQLIGQNVLGEFPKSTPLMEGQSDPMCSIEYQLEQLMPTSLEHQTKPGETPSIEDVNKNFANVEDFNKTKKVNSWASNYLQSIGHNNLKAIKINTSLSKNKNQTIKTISKKSKESNETVVQPTFWKGKTSSNEDFNMTENAPKFIKASEKIISKHKNIGNVETLHPVNVNVCSSRTNKQSEVHVKMIPVHPMSENILSTSVNSNVMLDTLYSHNNINKAPAYATLLAKGIGEATYCYNDGKREIDVYDAIKSKINHELAIEQKQHSTMNLPTHKKMCEDFIKKISNNKASKSDRKNKSTMKPETKPNLVNKDNKLNKESSKDTKKQTSAKDLVKKSKSSLKVDKSEKKKKKLDKTCQLTIKQQNIKPIIDVKDFNSKSKHIFDKETKKQPESQSPDRQKLKRVRANSENLHSSGIRTQTPIRSVVQVTENCHSNPPKRQCLDESFDLRSKLSRVNERIYRKTHIQRDTQSMNKIPKPRENLKITFEHQTDEKPKSPKKSGVLKKSKKCKKLKLIINVVCPGSSDETTSSDSSYSETENNPSHNMDLSFLDDFNVDEIVDCLKHSPKHKIKSPLHSHNKIEDHTKRSPEPELKLSTILNMLGAKSAETNKFKNPARTDFMTEETMKNTSATRSNDLNNLSLASNGKSSSLKSEENANNKINCSQYRNNTTHALVKILSETKLHLDQEKTASWEEGYVDAKCGIKTEDNTNKSQEDRQASENNTKTIIDESVIIIDPGISIIDLADETVVDATATNIAAKLNQSELPNNKNKQVKSVVINNIENNLKPALNEYRNNIKEKIKNKFQTINGQQMEIDLDKNEKIFIDLTIDSVDDGIKSNLSINTIPADTKYKLDAETPGKNNAEVGKQKYARTETDFTNEILTKQQEIHLIPLPNVYVATPKENEKLNHKNENYKSTHENKPKEIGHASPTKKGNGDSKTEEIIYIDNQNVKTFETNPVKIMVSDETNIKIMKEKPQQSLKKNGINRKLGSMITKDNASKANKTMSKVFETKAAKKVIKNIVESVWGSKVDSESTYKMNNDAKNEPENTSKTINGTKNKPQHTKTNIGTNIEHEPKIINSSKTEPENIAKISKGIKNEHEITLKTNNGTKNTSKTNDGPKTEPDNVAKISKGTKNEPENESKINSDPKIEPEHIPKINKGTKNEPKNTSKTNNGTTNEPANTLKTNSVEKKVENNSNLTAEHKSLAVLLEKRMLEYLHKDIKLVRLIHFGKYSKIYSCKDSNGHTYAAKVMLKNEKSRYLVGIKQEQMLRNIQQDIPKENLNTVELIKGFTVERYWCFLTEYYPKTLKQVLQGQKNMKPFHIDLVQGLARQLISAVMVLRNNGIVHSDIKPAHILMNASHNRIKLCGFDAAYYLNNMYLLPNIGTNIYRAPEIILGFSAGFSIDVWSTALVIHQMATNQFLFTGFYNNAILFKQMSTFGNLPMDMVEASLFKNQHFKGNTFMKRVGIKGQDAVFFNKFYKTKRLQMSLMLAYENHWATNEVYQRDSDMFKLTALHRLLEQMLQLDPRWRLTIEFVCADPFIYELFA